MITTIRLGGSKTADGGRETWHVDVIWRSSSVASRSYLLGVFGHE